MNRRSAAVLAVTLFLAASASAQPRSRETRAEGVASPSAQPRGSEARADAVAVPRAVAPRGALQSDERETIGIFERTSPSVVYITTIQHVRDFFNRNVTRVPQGTGSGFVWDEHGNVVTNFHVIQGAQEALVTLAISAVDPASLVGASPEHDIAVLHIDAPARSRCAPCRSARAAT